MRRRIVSIVLLAIGSIAAPAALAGAQAIASAPRVTMFGDSIASSLLYVPEARKILGAGTDLRLELIPCRRLVLAGCPFQGTRPLPVLDIVRSSTPSDLGDIVIVDVGYNEPPADYGGAMAAVVDALLARGVGHVIWVTMRETSDGYRAINTTIRDRAGRERRVTVADWEEASRGKPWFRADGLHLYADGAIGLANFLRPYVMSACGSACASRRSEVPRNVVLPVLRGTPVPGRVLQCSSGKWVGSKPMVFSYRWLRNKRVLAGSHTRLRLVAKADRGKRVACRVWAANIDGARSATSRPVFVRR
jgi:hypothetical protein